MTKKLAIRKPTKTAPAVPAAPPTADPVQALNYILTNNGTPELVRQAMAIANAYQDREAARIFGERFALFQAELPQIEKTRWVQRKEGGRMYAFAALEDIDEVVQPIKAKHGLSTSGTIKSTPERIDVVWELQIGSHVKQREFVLPPIPPQGLLQGGANATQNLGAWMKYLHRYTYCMALGIVVRDEDTDAQTVKDMSLLTDDQRAKINHWLTHGIVKPDGTLHRFTEASLLKWRQPNLPESERSLDKLTGTDYEHLVAMFKPKE